MGGGKAGTTSLVERARDQSIEVGKVGETGGFRPCLGGGGEVVGRGETTGQRRCCCTLTDAQAVSGERRMG